MSTTEILLLIIVIELAVLLSGLYEASVQVKAAAAATEASVNRSPLAQLLTGLHLP